MYTLTEAWPLISPNAIEMWDGTLACLSRDATSAEHSFSTQGNITCYAFTLVRQGAMTFFYEGQRLTLTANMLCCYTPGMLVSFESASADYLDFTLFVDEQQAYNTPIMRTLIYTTLMPFAGHRQPTLSLSAEDSQHLTHIMMAMTSPLTATHRYKAERLEALYTLFLIDLLHLSQHVLPQMRAPKRQEELFIEFVRLASKHFVQHRDIGFYADLLHITPIYLSRIVKQVTHRTVVDHLNRLLIIEATWRLRSTKQSISQIAYDLHFADVSGFSKFFARFMGQSPKSYVASTQVAFKDSRR